MLPVTADSSSLEVMIEVVNLNCQSDLVAGLADISDVVHVGSLLVFYKVMKQADQSFIVVLAGR